MKQPKCPSDGEWIKKVWYIHIMEDYSTIRNEILKYYTLWMNFKDIMLGESSQVLKKNTLDNSIYMKSSEMAHL